MVGRQKKCNDRMIEEKKKTLCNKCCETRAQHILSLILKHGDTLVILTNSKTVLICLILILQVYILKKIQN